MEVDQKVCNNCKIYLDKREEFLRNNNSSYDAAVDMWFFIEECKKTCSGELIERVFTRDDEEPSCVRCDYCQTGAHCEHCNETTHFVNYRRTEAIGLKR